MKNMLKLAIVIPTFNRIEKLKIALKNIEKQVFNQNVDLTVVISNIHSTDGTFEFLKTLKENSSNNIRYECNNNLLDLSFNNFYQSSKAIPIDVDWVWFHGDDDYLTQPNSIQLVVDVINQHQSEHLYLIHVSQFRRSLNTGEILKSNIFNLCNVIGYHDLLGWMSSLVVRKDKFVQGIELALPGGFPNKLYPPSAYSHSAGILESCIDGEAIFFDLGLIEPQDENETEESIQRRINENMEERYLYVIDDLISMLERKIIQPKCTLTFFRYVNHTFWDRWSNYLIRQVLNSGLISESCLQHILRLEKVSRLLATDQEQKLFIQWQKSLQDQLHNYSDSMQSALKIKKSLINKLEINNLSTFPFKTLF